MKKVFISQPMRGRSAEEITNERELLITEAKKHVGDDIEALDTYFKDFNGNALACLGKSISMLAQADIAVFGNGWEYARGCRIEHRCCEEYGVLMLKPFDAPSVQTCLG